MLRWYTLAIIFISVLIIVSDTVLYTYWGFRMDYTPFLYLKTPGEAAASVTTGKLVMYCILIAGLTLFFFLLYRKYIDRFFSESGREKYRLLNSVFFMILTAALIIPIRGGVGIAPINAGSVYFSQKMFVNHTAINVVWNVGSSYFNRKPFYLDLGLRIAWLQAPQCLFFLPLSNTRPREPSNTPTIIAMMV